jgi:hypothetical protein
VARDKMKPTWKEKKRILLDAFIRGQFEAFPHERFIQGEQFVQKLKKNRPFGL